MACEAKTPTAHDLLGLELAIRMGELWALLDTTDELTLGVVAAVMRAAYGQGYTDCLRDREPGSFLRALGFRVPAAGGEGAR